MAISGNRRGVVRLLRAAPHASFEQAATAAGISISTKALVDTLRDADFRGRCDAVAATVFRAAAEPGRVAVLRSRHCPPVLTKLAAQDPSNRVQEHGRGIAGWNGRLPRASTAPRACLVKAARAPYKWDRSRAAQNVHTPPAVLVAFAADNETTIRDETAANNAAPVEALAALAVGDYTSQIAAARNPKCVSVLLNSIAATDNDDAVHTISMHRSCTRATIAVLASHDNVIPRAAAAAHELCDPATLKHLALDDDEDVRDAVAANPKCDAGTLTGLATDPDWAVRAAVAANPKCGAGTLAGLITDPDWEVRDAAETNPNCDPSVVAAMSISNDPEIRAEAARHRLCPPQILRKLASDEHWDVREGVAESRAGCDRDILAELAADDATAVRRAAQNALRSLGAR